MLHRSFNARHAAHRLTGLDFGLRVHVELRPAQQTVFATAPCASLQRLTSELASMVSSLRVYSFAVRGQLEDVTAALQFNVQCGDWRYARYAALDVAALISQAYDRRLVNGSTALRAVDLARRLGDLCAQEVR